jgi:hypothetical protein
MLKTDDTHHTYIHTHKMRQIINKTISGCYPQWIGLETMSQKLCMYNIIICTIIYNYVYTYIYILHFNSLKRCSLSHVPSTKSRTTMVLCMRRCMIVITRSFTHGVAPSHPGVLNWDGPNE